MPVPAVMLRREVITDPAQIAPVREQVRSVMPWWRRALAGLLLALGGCCDTPVPDAPTWMDAAREVAMGQCSRWIECGTSSEQWQECVDGLVRDVCLRLPDTRYRARCGDPYPGNLEEVSRCSMWYEQVTCSAHVEPCTI